MMVAIIVRIFVSLNTNARRMGLAAPKRRGPAIRLTGPSADCWLVAGTEWITATRLHGQLLFELDLQRDHLDVTYIDRIMLKRRFDDRCCARHVVYFLR